MTLSGGYLCKAKKFASVIKSMLWLDGERSLELAGGKADFGRNLGRKKARKCTNPSW